MPNFLSSIDRAAKNVDDAGGKKEDSYLAFQMLDKLPDTYDGLLSQIVYQEPKGTFTSEAYPGSR